MKDYKFIFFGKILGFYYELNENYEIDKNSKIQPASTINWFKQNAKKAYPGIKLYFNKVGN